MSAHAVAQALMRGVICLVDIPMVTLVELVSDQRKASRHVLMLSHGWNYVSSLTRACRYRTERVSTFGAKNRNGSSGSLGLVEH